MSQDDSQFDFDDLVYIMSPSPAPQPLDNHSHTDTASPESLPEVDVLQMRNKVMQMRSIDDTDTKLTQREKELAEMVLKLTAAVKPDSDQLMRQADMISALIQQRDLLLRQAEEQHLRWNSEKDSWARMAEALLVQQAKNRLNSERDEDWERLHTAEIDNRGLRQRLNETQSRLQTLESELTRLRPLLLMQPLISRLSMPPPTPIPKTQLARRRKKNAVVTDEEHGASEDDAATDPFGSQETPRAKSRKPEAPNNRHKRRPSHKSVSRSVSVDARVEHLLLAARRVGKQRAGIMSGMVQHLEERERERRREESATTIVATTPKTPKRHIAPTAYPDGGYVYMSGQMRPTNGMQPVPLFIPAYPHHIIQTPSSSTAPSAPSSTQKPKPDAGKNNPPTPLDSLLSAARSMMREDIDDEDEEVNILGDSLAETCRHARSRDVLGSPVPKRRKVVATTSRLPALSGLGGRAAVAANMTGPSSADVNESSGRVRSGLDVLADQAAAFITQEPSVTLSQMQSGTPAKGKGKAKGEQQEPSKSRGRTRVKKRGVKEDIRSSFVEISRSRTPRSDVEDGLGDATHDEQHAQVGGSSDVPVDPGEKGGAPSDPSHVLDSTLISDGDRVAIHGDKPCRRSLGTSPPDEDVEDATQVTPRQGQRVQAPPVPDGSVALSSSPSILEDERDAHSASPQPTITPREDNSDRGSSSGPIVLVKNKELARVTKQDEAAPPPTKRQRSPYIKWSKEEDELLAQAVAKYGQKWDLVQKALPSRGYHQVRQRWLRKLGVFDSKPDLSSFQTATTATRGGESIEPRGLKLGLAPLSSEKMFSVVGRPSSLSS